MERGNVKTLGREKTPHPAKKRKKVAKQKKLCASDRAKCKTFGGEHFSHGHEKNVSDEGKRGWPGRKNRVGCQTTYEKGRKTWAEGKKMY